MKWPWKRYRISDEQRADSRRRLAHAKAQQPRVDALTSTAADIIRRNHLGENIHLALKGKP